MFEFNYKEAFDRLLKYYYSECPGRIMPLLLLYLARKSRPGKSKVYIEEKIRRPLDWADDPEKRYVSPILSQYTKEDAMELALADPAGKHMLDRWECNGMDHMSVVVHISDEKIKAIRSFFQKKDEALGESMSTRKALFSFVQGLERIPKDVLSNSYLVFADMLLKQAGVLSEKEDYDLSVFEKLIIGKVVSGNVFVPQAKSPYLAASFSKANIVTESAGPNAELESMVSYLLINGNGCENVTCTFVQKPFIVERDDKYDYVIMNRAAHNQYTQHSDWHECLKNIKNNLSDTCKFIGLVENKYLFAMLDKQNLFKEVIENKELEKVILLPKKYGCSLLVLNKAKKNKDYVQFVDLYNEDITSNYDSVSQIRRYKLLIKKHSVKSTIEVLQKASHKIQKFFDYRLPEIKDFTLEPLRKFLRRITPSSSFSVSNTPQDDAMSVIKIDRQKPYSPFNFMAKSVFADTFSIYHNHYYLDDSSLIVNRNGALNALLYDGSVRPAYIKDALAFKIMNGKIYPEYIINELRKPYVQTQLDHWSHSAEGNHSEDEILDLKIYIPVDQDAVEAEKDICSKELDQSILPVGYEINNFYSGDEYTIKKCLGRGGFGISYLAKKSNYMYEEKEVVLKEYLAVGFKGQESQRNSNHWVSIKLGDIDEIKGESSVYTYLVKFIEEAELMRFFGRFPDCRIRTASKIFKYEETNTCYYEMEYYKNGTLMDELENNGLMSEDVAVKRVMCPLARAIKTMHDNMWLHLDIKAENVMMDDDGIAVLGDLGISQQYDSSGKKITKGGGLGSSGACELQFNEIFTKEFHPELDIYSLAAMYYFMLTGKTNHRYFDSFDLNGFEHISETSKNAIIKALDPSLKNTPKDIISFMRMLPGCEDFDLPVIEPEPEAAEDFDLCFDDLDFEDFDMPDFDSGLIPTDSGGVNTY